MHVVIQDTFERRRKKQGCIRFASDDTKSAVSVILQTYYNSLSTMIKPFRKADNNKYNYYIYYCQYHIL